jgi:hypothetical protein
VKDIKQYLKQLDNITLKKLLKISDLDELEYWVMYYGYVKKRMVENTCMKLNISRAYYFIIKNKAFIKIYYKLRELQKV